MRVFFILANEKRLNGVRVPAFALTEMSLNYKSEIREEIC